LGVTLRYLQVRDRRNNFRREKVNKNLSGCELLVSCKMSNAYTDGPRASAPGASSGVLVILKQKMQNLREDLDKYKDMYEAKCAEADRERSRRNEVNLYGKISGFETRYTDGIGRM